MYKLELTSNIINPPPQAIDIVLVILSSVLAATSIIISQKSTRFSNTHKGYIAIYGLMVIFFTNVVPLAAFVISITTLILIINKEQK